MHEGNGNVTKSVKVIVVRHGKICSTLWWRRYKNLVNRQEPDGEGLIDLVVQVKYEGIVVWKRIAKELNCLSQFFINADQSLSLIFNCTITGDISNINNSSNFLVIVTGINSFKPNLKQILP